MQRPDISNCFEGLFWEVRFKDSYAAIFKFLIIIGSFRLQILSETFPDRTCRYQPSSFFFLSPVEESVMRGKWCKCINGCILAKWRAPPLWGESHPCRTLRAEMIQTTNRCGTLFVFGLSHLTYVIFQVFPAAGLCLSVLKEGCTVCRAMWTMQMTLIKKKKKTNKKQSQFNWSN